MVGEEFLIGKFSSMDTFVPAAISTLASALNWSINDNGSIQSPNSNFSINVTPYDEFDFLITISNGTIDTSVKIRRQSDYMWYWNILKTVDGVIAIGVTAYQFSSIGSIITKQVDTTFPIVFAVSSNNVWGCIINNSNYNSTSTTGTTRLFNDNSISLYDFNPKPLSSGLYKYTSLAKLPDPLKGGVFNGLYIPLAVSKEAYLGVFEVGGKRFHNVTRASFSIAVALN